MSNEAILGQVQMSYTHAFINHFLEQRISP